jgi:hypothetical protein
MSFMRPVLTILGLIGFTQPVMATAGQLVAGPWLQRPTPTSMVIGFESATDTISEVLWGPSPMLGNQTFGDWLTSSAGTHIHHVELTNLQPGTRYWYLVRTESIFSNTWSFTTPPLGEDEAPLTFLAISDSQVGSDATKLAEIVNDGIIPFMAMDSGGQELGASTNFMIIPGDLVGTGSNHAHWTSHFFGQAGPVLRQVPLLPALGNHEANANLYFEYFDLPTDSGTENWYVTDLGNVRVITLDSNIGGQSQLLWVDDLLSEAADMDEIDFIIAQLHHPHQSEQWTPGESTFTTDVVKRLEVWTTATGKPSVHVFGHTHGYSRGQRRDHRHLMVNAASAMGSLDYWGYYPNVDYQDFTVSRVDWGFCVFNVEAGDNPSLELRRISRGNDWIARDNELVDSITIRRFNDPPQTPAGVFPGPDDQPSVGWAVDLEGNTFVDPDGDDPLSSHWQVSTDAGDWTDPVLDELKNSENWYRPVGGQAWYSENLVTDPTISRVTLRQSIPGCQTLYWRVRYRDDGLQWSDWSDPTAFQSGESDWGPDAPSPADEETGASRTPLLQWGSCLGADSWDVYVGYDAELTKADYATEVFTPEFQLDPLPAQTTIYWRVDAHRDGLVQTGNLWHFTTTRGYPTDWTAEWRFDDSDAQNESPLDTARGTSPLVPTGMIPEVDWQILDTGGAVPHIGGRPGRYVQMNSIHGVNRGLRTWLTAPGTGGDINRWTLVWDLYITPGQGGLVPLFQGNDTNSNQTEAFLDCNTGGFIVNGTGAVGAGSWQHGTWFRLVMRGDYGTGEAAIFVDGSMVVGPDDVSAPDWLWGGGSEKSIWFLTDDGPASETGPVACSALAVVDDMMGDADIADLGGPDARGVFADRIAEWRFDDASSEDDMPFQPAHGDSVLTPRAMNHGVNWNLVDATIKGESARAIQMDNIFGNHQGLELFLQHPGNAGLGCCDLGHFTLAWDLYIGSDQDQLQCLWQGNADNSNDGELFVDCSTGGFHVSGSGDVGENHWPLGEWFRLVHVVDYVGGTNRLYVNGALVEDLASGVDWLYGSGSNLPVWLLTDNGPDSDVSLVQCAAAAVVDRLLTSEEVLALGGPDAKGLFLDNGSPCGGDVTGDGSVDVEDVLMVIAGYGTIYTVDDLLEVLAAFGSSC